MRTPERAPTSLYIPTNPFLKGLAIGTPEINLGLIPGYGATQRLAKLVGYGKTLEMVMTGEMIGALDAKSIGLVNHVCSPDELENFTLDIANKIASKSVLILTTAKRVIKASLNNTLEEGVQLRRKNSPNYSIATTRKKA